MQFILLMQSCIFSIITPVFSVTCVRVLSLRSDVIHGFCDRALTLPSCPVFSLVCVPCFMLELGVRIPALISWVSVSCRGSDTRALPCLALPCLALPCLALPCLALPCLALPCLALPCPVLSAVLLFPYGVVFVCLLVCLVLFLINKNHILCSIESSTHPFTPHTWQHDPSEIILKCWLAAQETFRITTTNFNYVKNRCAA